MSSTKKKTLSVRVEQKHLNRLAVASRRNRWLKDMVLSDLVRMALEMGIEKIEDDTEAELGDAA